MRVLDAAAVAAWADASARRLEALRGEIDSINVYPVPDSDTGSNLLYTMNGASAALSERTATGAGEAFAVLARGAVGAARGNSGVILSQVLLGIADSVGDAAAVDARGLAAALTRAERTATDAVARPAEGTILTVLREARDAAAGTESSSLSKVSVAAASAAANALARTPQLLPVLADAGVVDAGGRGLLVLFDELTSVVTGKPPVARPEFAVPAGFALTAAPDAGPGPRWEVMYLLDGVTGSGLPALRDALSELGDCVTIAADGAGSHAVHVHCDDIGAAIDAGLLAGRPHNVRVEGLAHGGHSRKTRAVLAMVGGALAELCRSEGVTVLEADSAHPPSSDAVSERITGLGVSHVIVLPGGAEFTKLADDAAEKAVSADRDVVVIPCASSVQVLAALAVHDPGRRASDDVVAMAEAAAATRRGELAIAGEDAMTWVGRVNAGDIVGFVDDEVVLVTKQSAAEPVIVDSACALLDRMLSAGGELVTVLLGDGAPEGVDDAIAARLAEQHPEIEVAAYPGGQPGSMLSFGVE